MEYSTISRIIGLNLFKIFIGAENIIDSAKDRLKRIPKFLILLFVCALIVWTLYFAGIGFILKKYGG